MKGSTHLAAGVAAGAALASMSIAASGGFVPAYPEAYTAAYTVFAGSVVGSLVPDIDCPDSKMGRRIRFISVPVNRLFGHRGMLHSPLLYLVACVFLYQFFPVFTTGFAVGTATHLFLDLLNPGGVPLLWPWGHKFRIAKIPSDSLAANRSLSLLMLLASAVFTLWKLGLWPV